MNESQYKRQIKIPEGQKIEIGCPVKGIPTPSIVWLMNMQQLLEEGEESRGVKLGQGGNTV